MDDAAIGAGRGEVVEQHLGVVDHQVTVQEQIGVGAQRFHDRRANGQVRHEVAVHHVDVKPIGPARLGRGGGIGQSSEIGRQDRGREQWRVQRVPLSRGNPAGIIDVASPAFSGEDLPYV